MTLTTSLLLALGITAVIYALILGNALIAARRAIPSDNPVTPTVAGTTTGFVTNFFDTLGIGSFATTTSIFRQWRLVPDEIIPGTLNVGHTIPAIVQAFIFIRIVPVDGRTLALMIAAAVTGAWLGAGAVASWPRRQVQLGMGAALFGAAIIMSMTLLSLVPGGGSDLSLSGSRLIVAVTGNFVLGALMTLGIGLYAPCMILVSLLGMNPTAAFPIMMGSCAFLMPVASTRFIRAGSHSPRISLGLLLGGIPAVLIAAFIVKSLPLTAVRFLVVIVVLYTSVSLIRAARRERQQLRVRVPDNLSVAIDPEHTK
jgi:uncharacterized membrane protein YfcA